MKKHIKKIMALFVVLTLMMGISACGSEPEEIKGAATCWIEQNGVVTTMVLDAKGDTVTQINQEAVLSLNGYSEDQIKEVEKLVSDAEAVYAGIEGVTYKAVIEDEQLIETIIIPTDTETLQSVIQAGMLPVDDENVTLLSLQSTLDNLEAAGWTVE